MPGWVQIVTSLTVLLVILLLRNHGRKSGIPIRPAYQKKEFLIPAAERLFYLSLKNAVEPDFCIFKIANLSDVLTQAPANQKLKPPDFQEQAGQINFVLCNSKDLTIACAIKLFENSFGIRKKDNTLDITGKICRSAGLPLAIFETNPVYIEQEIRNTIMQAIDDERLLNTNRDGRTEPTFKGLEKTES